MAPFTFRPPLQQHLLIPSIASPCKYPSSHCYSSPHFLTLSLLSHTFIHELPPISTLNSHICNLSEKIPHREYTHENKPRNHTTQRALGSLLSSSRPPNERIHRNAKKPEGSPVAGEQMEGHSRNRGSRGYGEMDISKFPSLSSREQGQGGKSKAEEVSTGIKKAKNGSEKAKTASREAFELRIGLDMCSKTGDVMSAIALHDKATKEGVKLEQYHYNVLLYLCSSAAIGVIHPAKSGSSGEDDSIPIQVSDDVIDYARERGFQIYEKMCLEKIPMSEAALTSVARLAMSMGDGDRAFDIVKQMKEMGIAPRLRSYGPSLYTFCDNGDVERAFEVERHMVESEVYPEEPELEALLRVSVGARRGERVYYVLHKLRTRVRKVSPSIVELIEAWFRSPTAARVGKRKWDREMVAQAVENGGGGWHGLGWLGRGKWGVKRTQIDANGFCLCCGEKLVTIDLDPIEAENLARSVASIASKRDRSSSFQKFQKWLDYYGPFEAVVDAANVGLFSQRRFSLIKVNAVVNGIRQKLPLKKWPLIIVHNRRLLGGKMEEPLNAKLIEKWKNADAIYATPTGSNDDWYWLYAAIKCKGLIVTNDEMRDHIFQILGNDFFPKWKERHQVHFSLDDGNFEFDMPPPYSVVIQESKEGNWHIPISVEHEPERERSWLCVTRANSFTVTQESSIPQPPIKKMVKNLSPGAEAQNQILLLSGNGSEHITECSHTKTIIVQRNRASIESPNLNSITSDIEAAEQLSGRVIDFQI